MKRYETENERCNTCYTLNKIQTCIGNVCVYFQRKKPGCNSCDAAKELLMPRDVVHINQENISEKLAMEILC